MALGKDKMQGQQVGKLGGRCQAENTGGTQGPGGGELHTGQEWTKDPPFLLMASAHPESREGGGDRGGDRTTLARPPAQPGCREAMPTL